jgi:glycosyltransferase involved in cell wall biosynthesis
MTPPTFTVLIPAFNSASTVGAAVSSVLAQTRNDFELIVVDDGSSDETPEVLRRFESDPRMVLVVQENLGPAAASNAGLRRARGRYVAVLDDDDLLMPDYLERIGRVLDADPGAGIVYPDAWILDDRTKRFRKRTAFESLPRAPARISGEEFICKLIERNFLPHCSVVRRDAVIAAGAYDTALTGVMDWDLWIRVAARGYGAVRLPVPLMIWRDRPGSVSTNRLLMARDRYAVLLNAAERYELPEAARSTARRRLRHVGRDIRALSGERSLAAAAARLRRRLNALRWRLADRDLMATAPPAVAAAFPDLRAPSRG